MTTQPYERASDVSTPALPLMPAGGKSKGGGKSKEASPPKPKQTRTDTMRLAKAKKTRRNSLRKQREALRG
jgi:hypothetical protein